MGDSLLTKLVLKDCVITRADQEMKVDLIVLDFLYLDAGMDWLSAYHARVDCVLEDSDSTPCKPSFELVGVCDEYPARISAIHATPLLVAPGTWLSFRRATRVFWALKTYHRYVSSQTNYQDFHQIGKECSP